MYASHIQFWHIDNNPPLRKQRDIEGKTVKKRSIAVNIGYNPNHCTNIYTYQKR